MCKVYTWREVQPDGTPIPRQRLFPCENGNNFNPCRHAAERPLPDIMAPRGYPAGPAMVSVEPASASNDRRRRQTSRDLRVEFEIPFFGKKKAKDNKDNKGKKNEPVSPLPQPPYHPFFDRNHPQYGVNYFTPAPMAVGPPPIYHEQPFQGHQFPPLPFRPNPEYRHSIGPAIVDVEPAHSPGSHRSGSPHHHRAPSPVPRVHGRRSTSVDIVQRAPRSPREERRGSRYPRESRNPREQQIQDRIRELEREKEEADRRAEDAQRRAQRAERRAEIERNINALRQEAANLRRARDDQGQREETPARRRDTNTGGTRPIFPPRRGGRTVVVHQGDRQTERPGQDAGLTSGAPRGHSRWDSGVDIVDDARRDLEDRGRRVIRTAAEEARDEGRGRLRGGWDSRPGVRGLLDNTPSAPTFASLGLRRNNTERVVYEREGRGGRTFFGRRDNRH